MTTLVPAIDRLTIADLLALPDGDRYELVDGRLVERLMGVLSSLVAARLVHALIDHCEQAGLGFVFGADLGYACFPGRPDQVRRPDASLLLAARVTPGLFDQGLVAIRPDLAVEVVSPGDRVIDLRAKLADYRDAAIPIVWLIHPDDRTVEVIRSDRTRTDLGPDDDLTGEAVLPGFRRRVADLFAGLPR